MNVRNNKRKKPDIILSQDAVGRDPKRRRFESGSDVDAVDLPDTGQLAWDTFKQGKGDGLLDKNAILACWKEAPIDEEYLYHFLAGSFVTNDLIPSSFDSPLMAIQTLEEVEHILSALLAAPVLLMNSKNRIAQAVAGSILGYVSNALPGYEYELTDEFGNLSMTKERLEKIKYGRLQIRYLFRDAIRLSIASLQAKFSVSFAGGEKQTFALPETTKCELLTETVTAQIDTVIESQTLDRGTIVLFLLRALALSTDDLHYFFDKLYASFPCEVSVDIIRAFNLFHDLYYNNEVRIEFREEKIIRKSALDWWFGRLGPWPDFQADFLTLLQARLDAITTGCEEEILSQMNNRIRAEEWLESNQEWKRLIDISFQEDTVTGRRAQLAEILNVSVPDIAVQEEIFDVIFGDIEAVRAFLDAGVTVPELLGVASPRMLDLILEENEEVIKLIENNARFAEISGIRTEAVLDCVLGHVDEINNLMQEGDVPFSEIINIDDLALLSFLLNKTSTILALMRECQISFCEISAIQNIDLLVVILRDADGIAWLLHEGNVSFDEIADVFDADILTFLLCNIRETVRIMDKWKFSFSEIEKGMEEAGIKSADAAFRLLQYADQLSVPEGKTHISFADLVKNFRLCAAREDGPLHAMGMFRPFSESDCLKDLHDFIEGFLPEAGLPGENFAICRFAGTYIRFNDYNEPDKYIKLQILCEILNEVLQLDNVFVVNSIHLRIVANRFSPEALKEKIDSYRKNCTLIKPERHLTMGA